MRTKWKSKPGAADRTDKQAMFVGSVTLSSIQNDEKNLRPASWILSVLGVYGRVGRVNGIKMRSVMLLGMMLLMIWLVPWIWGDLLWIVPVGLAFLGRKNVMLSERGYWSWSFHLGLDGRCWDGWFGVDHAFGFGLRGGIVSRIVLGVVGKR